MSDFVSRLLARSHGEKPMVRPRVAAAFAQPLESSDRAPAGEVLREGPASFPAMAPLPTEPVHAITRVKHRTVVDDPPRPGAASPSANLLEDKNPHLVSKESQEKRTEKETGRTHVTREPVASQSTKVSSTEHEVLERVSIEPASAVISEMREAPVFQGRSSREPQGNSLRPTVVDPASAQQPAPPASRPAIRNSEQRAENPRKKETSEPAIQVTIGRIEVRASVAAPKTSEKKMPTGAMSLEEYQRMRNRRSAG